MKNIPKICIIFFVVGISAVFASKYLFRPKPQPQTVRIETKQATNSGEFTASCSDVDLRLDALDPFVKQNSQAMKIIRESCLWVMKADQFDVTGDGKSELILNTSGFDCGSCHGRELYIIQADKVIFHTEGDDSQILPNKTEIGFTLIEPIRAPTEAMCCATKQKVIVYRYNALQEALFYRISEITEKIDQNKDKAL